MAKQSKLFDSDRPKSQDISWCPGCGNFGIRNELMDVLEEMQYTPKEIAVISGIGQAGKMPHYLTANGFHTLHGRSLPIATATKAVNPALEVIAIGGDGDMFAEGGNHLLHTIKRNPNITVIVHNNQIYGLTKGQGSPTSLAGMKTTTQPWGVYDEPMNSIALVVSQGCSFVARTFMGYKDETKEIIKNAINHVGFSYVEIFQPCVTFNKVNTFMWYKNNTYFMKDHNVMDKEQTMIKAFEKDPYPLGIFYVNKEKPCFDNHLPPYKDNTEPLYKREPDFNKIRKKIELKRG
ncbi:pyruvate ferredoxin/flavodoxin oxidoreductase, beta subunit [Flexistipes sinusarabici DSM 4947]|uniref:Pyruvate ferredoxin/flavodoxin oxidoreductase, beta subunit n=1 Tax=Flexistipes sinusarabici (strain ATCC 49648 / DSM 4947 / MAS 10) TaxID=717231 RepID=F8E4X6_FLESM|nr:thiamine pyrophosphate-dependent enzyme [Flexistipes sinusarabici]AEI14546.1 pyruvate ferredoxin/flavodoxin oxidoreductase, beta subunit [Flexistipes sinusarabici DSM 4947]